MRSLVLVLVGVVAGCAPQPKLPESLDTNGGSSSSGDTGHTTGPSTDGGASSDGPGGAEAGSGEGGESSGEASTGGCEAEGCEEQPPTLLWSVEVEQTYGDGACLDIVEDGQGGLFASYIGYGFEAYSDVIAVDSSGEFTGLGRGADTGAYIGLAPRGPGLFDWAAASGHVGIADQTLQNLDGGLLTSDVDQIRAMTRSGDELVYVARTTPTYRCVVRTGSDPGTDSLPFDCAPNFSLERLAVDGFGNRFYAEPNAYRVQRLDPAGLLYGQLDGRWNRVGFDVAADPQGHLWVVGGLGSDGNDLFGSFIARHSAELDEDPVFEDSQEGDVAWTAVVMTVQGPVVFGHEGFGEFMHARGLSLDGALRWSWSMESPPRTYVDALALDAAGDLLLCGTRYTGVQTPVGSDVHQPVLYKFSF